MMENPNLFNLPVNYIDTIDVLPNEDAGLLFKKILKYVNGNTLNEENNLLVTVAFLQIKHILTSQIHPELCLVKNPEPIKSHLEILKEAKEITIQSAHFDVICMQNGVSKDEGLVHVERFFIEQQLSQEHEGHDMKEILRHFVNWFRKQCSDAKTKSVNPNSFSVNARIPKKQRKEL